MLLIAVGLSATAQPQYGHLDTIFGRCERYLYPEWYDECPAYQDDTNGFIGELYYGNGDSWAGFHSGTNRRVCIKEYRVSEPTQISGLVALVAIRDTLSENTPRPSDAPLCMSQERAPEMMILCQGGALRPLPLGMVSESHYLLPIDSVRWDTATPSLMYLPLSINSNPSDTLHSVWCYAYEAYFPQPVTVDSVFYIMGTFRSCTMETYEHPVYGTMRVYSYYPTAYVTILDWLSEYCNRCTGNVFFYDTYYPFYEGYNYGTRSGVNNMWSGAFLPIRSR